MGADANDNTDAGAKPDSDSNPTKPTTSTNQDLPAKPAADDLGDAGKRALDDERKARRDAEKQLKTAQAQLADLQKAQMSDQEKAIAEAVAAAEARVRAETGSQLVGAKFEAALADRQVDVKALLDGLDLTKFLDADGLPDSARIVAWVDKVAPKPERKPPTAQGMGQGSRHGDSTGQIKTRDELRGMTAEQIEEARKAGRLNDLLNGKS